MLRTLTAGIILGALMLAAGPGVSAPKPVSEAGRALYAARVAHVGAGYQAGPLRKAREKYAAVVRAHPGTEEAAQAKEGIDIIDAVFARGRLDFTPPTFATLRDGFLNAVPRNDRPALRQALAKAADAEARADVVQGWLAEQHADFGAALTAFAEDRIAVATRRFEAVLKRARQDKQPYLATAAAYQLARCHVLSERYEDARPLLNDLTSRHAAQTFRGADSLFLLGVCEARLLNREVAVAVLQRFLTVYDDMPERMAMGATQLIADLMNVQRGSLADIVGRMNDARRRLGLARTGEPTQAQQERVVAMLDKMIDRIEKQQQQQGQGGGRGQGGGQSGDDASPRQGASESTARASSPRTGPLERVNRGRADDTWGRARQKEREEAMNVLKARFPERYRELVEQYFRSLQEEQP